MVGKKVKIRLGLKVVSFEPHSNLKSIQTCMHACKAFAGRPILLGLTRPGGGRTRFFSAVAEENNFKACPPCHVIAM